MSSKPLLRTTVGCSTQRPLTSSLPRVLLRTSSHRTVFQLEPLLTRWYEKPSEVSAVIGEWTDRDDANVSTAPGWKETGSRQASDSLWR